ncbi:retinoblastoma family protein-like [Anopheles nili]|uniref:retinoblastoma family protein-like n=1 Tax=Anopheles nili TaxID=185578 RepID=UPI00237AE9C1|nr:retinoblastoma family protein-like [Anopheles nili]
MTTTEETSPGSELVAMREIYREICRALNIDADTEKRSWQSYEKARNQFDLTGEPKHWMCCALYVACLQDMPVVGHPDHYIQGNGVNISNLLSQCNVSIQEFFSKMKQWSGIRSLPTRLQTAVDNLHHEFSVSIAAYTAFSEDFPRIFNETNITPDEPKRNKKSKPNPCSYKKLREFSWLLFLNVKEPHKEQRHDITTAMDLSVCVMDLVYRNVVGDGRMDLINANVLTEGGGNAVDGTTAAAAEAALLNFNVRDLLCNEYPTTIESVAETCNAMFLPTLAAMFETKDLRGCRVRGAEDMKQFTGLVSLANFEDNLKSLNRRYERSILRCGMLDERIALSSRVPPTSLRQRWRVHNDGYPKTPLSIKSRGTGFGTRHHDGTPGTRGFVTPDQTGVASFIVRGTYSQLMKKIQCHEPGKPRGPFLDLMSNCTPSPVAMVLENVSQVRQRFVMKLTKQEGWNPRTAESRFDWVEAMYHLLVENIIPWELKKHPTKPVSKMIFDMCSNSRFNETIMVCAAEIIFFLRQEQHNFPWILTVFGMEPFHFYQIIEVTVDANSDILTTEIVNHLRRVEEQIVDSLCWKSSSVLWETMEKDKYQIPACRDVEVRNDIAGITPLRGDPPMNHPNGTRGGSTMALATGSTSAASTSTASGRPVPHPDSAKKKLFIDPPVTPSKQAPSAAPSTVAAVAVHSATQSSSSSATGTGSTSGSSSSSMSATAASKVANAPGNSTNGSIGDPPSISSFSSPQRDSNDQPSTETKRLNFFFRKMYHVAYSRLCNLCQDLGIDSDVIHKLIWTIFEYTITKGSKKLMRDRHIDQLLMCAIFVTVRIKKLPNTFKQIMHCYHSQPQANSSIYRSVFIRHEKEEQQKSAGAGEENNGTNGAEANPPSGDRPNGDQRVAVTEMVGTSVQYDREVYGDIIKFYNDIYVVIVHEFAMQYYNTDVSQESLFLSPTPKSQLRNIQKSPRQISSNINLFVSTTNKISSLPDSPIVKTITFQASPGQSPTIHDRNTSHMTRKRAPDTCARRLTETAELEPGQAPKLRRLGKIHEERRHQDHESSENEEMVDHSA